MKRLAQIILITGLISGFFLSLSYGEEIDWQKRALKAEYELAAVKAQLENCQDQNQMLITKQQNAYDSNVENAVAAAKQAYIDYLKAEQARKKAEAVPDE